MLTVRTMNALRDRFPTGEERDRLAEYAGSVRARLAALQELEQVERQVVEATLDALRKLYPNFTRYHPVGWEKGYRDLQILLTYIGRSMFLNDRQLLDDQVLTWCRTIFKSLNFTPKFLRDSYTLLRENVRQRVKPRSYTLLEPYLDHTIEYLSDIPEPIRPEV